MATKWNILRKQFLIERSSTGVTLKAWCKSRNISYHTARRYIKVRAHYAQLTMRKNYYDQNEVNAQKHSTTNTNSIENQCVRCIPGEVDINKDVNKRVLSKKRVVVLDYQKVWVVDYNYEFINSYEEALQYLSALRESLHEGEKALTLLEKQESELKVEKKQILDAMSDEVGTDLWLSLNKKYFDTSDKWLQKSDQMFSLIRFLCSQNRRADEIDYIMFLMRDGKMQVNNLKRLHS